MRKKCFGYPKMTCEVGKLSVSANMLDNNIENRRMSFVFAEKMSKFAA